MDSDDDQQEGQGGGGTQTALVGFLFGNVDANLQLEDDYLDGDAKEHLGALGDGKLGRAFDGLKRDVTNAAQDANGTSGAALTITKADDAEDFAEEDELAEDVAPALPSTLRFAGSTWVVGGSKAAEADDYDDDYDEDEPASQAAVASKQEDAAGKGAGEAAPPEQQHRADGDEAPAPKLEDAGEGKGEDLVINNVTLGKINGTAVLSYTELFPTMRPIQIAKEQAERREQMAAKREVREPRMKIKRRLAGLVNGDVLDERDLMFKAADPSELAGDADDAEQDDAEALEEAVSLARERRVNGPERLEMVISDLDGTVTWGPEAKGGREGADGEAIEVAAELDRDGGRVAGGGGGAAVEVPEGNYGAPHQDEWETNIYWGSDDDEASQAEVGGIEEEEEEESAVMERGGEEGRERQGEKAAAEELQGGGGREVCWGQWELGVLGGSGLAGDGHGAVELSSYMLRLERHQEPETTGDKEEDGEQKTKTGRSGFQIGKLAPLNLERRDRDLADDDWLGFISWRGYINTRTKPKFAPLVLDLNDPEMIFTETSVSCPPSSAQHLSRSSAWIAPPAPKSKVALAPVGGPGKYAKMLARANVSKDTAYNLDSKGRKGEQGGSANKPGSRHALLALNMRTSALNLSEEELLSFHRPRAIMMVWPGKPTKLHRSISVKGKDKNPMITLTLRTLSGFVGVRKNIPAKDFTVKQVWAEWSKKMQRLDGEGMPQLRQDAPTGMVLPSKDGGTLFQAGIKASSTVWAIFKQVVPMNTAKISVLPKNSEPVRPPGAFTRMKELSSTTQGHLVLLEYMEEYPLLLNNLGMGAQITTFYRKTSNIDNNWKRIQDEVEVGPDGSASEKEKWMVGKVTPLNPDDDSPFLGEVVPGTSQAAIETNLFRAPASPHAPQSSDFLLVRLPSGAMGLREFTGSIMVGQQLPNVKIPVPGGVTEREYEDKRMQDYVYRDLRRKEKKIKDGSCPTISVAELMSAFPKYTDSIIRSRLKDKCMCVPVKGLEGDQIYCLREGARLPDEKVMRGTMTPDLVCAYESMRAALARLSRLGIHRPNLLKGADMGRIKMAVELLPEEPEVLKAAELIEAELQAAPWTLSTNFVEAVREGRGQLALAGSGEPTGRGNGFSFLKEVRKVADPSTAGLPRRDAGTITGTAADLRRLKIGDAETILIKLGVTKEEIQGRSRWELIGLVRDLSSAAAQDGGQIGARLNKFARSSRVSTAQAVQQYMERAQEIFQKQIKALTEPGVEGDSDDELEDELEDLLTQDEEKELDGGVRKKQAKQGGGPTEEDDEAALKALREEGFLKKRESSKAKRQDREEEDEEEDRPVGARPVEGTRRLRRTVTVTYKNGETETREIIYTDMSKVDWLRPLATSSIKLKPVFSARKAAQVPVRVPVVERAQAARKKAEEEKKKAEKEAKDFKKQHDRKAQEPIAKQQITVAGAGLGPRCGTCGEFGHTRTSELCPKHPAYQPPAPPVTTVVSLPKPEKKAKLPASVAGGPTMVILPPDSSTPVLPKVVLRTTMSGTPSKTASGKGKRKLTADTEAEGCQRNLYVDSATPPAAKKVHVAPLVAPDKPPAAELTKPKKLKVKTGGKRPAAQEPPPPIHAPAPPAVAAMAPPLMPAAQAPGNSRAQAEALCRVLKKVTDHLSSIPQYAAFKKAVKKREAPDYEMIIKEPMHLEKIGKRIASCFYTAKHDFIRDIQKMYDNCVAYNTPGTGGKYGHQAIIHNGECMLKDAMRQLEQLEHEIKEATKPVEDLWLNCDKCHKWRLVNQHVYDKYRRKGVKFYCQLLEDRPRELRSCSVEDDEVRRLRELNQAHGLLY